MLGMLLVVSKLTLILANADCAGVSTKMRFRRALTRSFMSGVQIAFHLASAILLQRAPFPACMALLLAIVSPFVPALESALNLLSFIATVSALQTAPMIRLHARMLMTPFCIIPVILPQ